MRLEDVITNIDFLDWMFGFIPINHPDMEGAIRCLDLIKKVETVNRRISRDPLEDSEEVVKQVKATLGEKWEVRMNSNTLSFHISLDVSYKALQGDKVNLVHVEKPFIKESKE